MYIMLMLEWYFYSNSYDLDVYNTIVIWMWYMDLNEKLYYDAGLRGKLAIG